MGNQPIIVIFLIHLSIPKSKILFKANNVNAAFDEPPPRPAPIGIFLCK